MTGRQTREAKVQLSPKQRAVVTCLAYGMTNQQTARRCGMALQTVKNHVSRLREATGAPDRTVIVLRAILDGALDLAELEPGLRAMCDEQRRFYEDLYGGHE
jgi:DNA-binding NarL/FixJ family response regulator